LFTEDDDDANRQALRQLLAGLDPVPSDVVAAAKASFTWLTIDAELAALSYDSLLSDELVGTRGISDTRSASFEYDSTSIEIEIEQIGGQRRVVGQIAPHRPTSLEVHRADDNRPVTVTTDDRGRFSVANLAPGQVRLFVQFAPGHGPSRLLTEWMSI
jgi:hypothetical protein